jgi:hypothetical protein
MKQRPFHIKRRKCRRNLENTDSCAPDTSASIEVPVYKRHWREHGGQEGDLATDSHASLRITASDEVNRDPAEAGMDERTKQRLEDNRIRTVVFQSAHGHSRIRSPSGRIPEAPGNVLQLLSDSILKTEDDIRPFLFKWCCINAHILGVWAGRNYSRSLVIKGGRYNQLC